MHIHAGPERGREGSNRESADIIVSRWTEKGDPIILLHRAEYVASGDRVEEEEAGFESIESRLCSW